MALFEVKLTLDDDAKELLTELIDNLKAVAGKSGVALDGGKTQPKEEPEDDFGSDAGGEESSGKPDVSGAAADWNPLDGEMKGRYSADHKKVLQHMLDERGIQWARSWTGDKLHAALLEAANAGEDAEAPTTEAESADAPAPKKGGESGKDKLKKLLVEASELVGRSKVEDVLKEIAGTVRLDKLTKETGPKVIEAVQRLIDDAKSESNSDDGGDW